MKRIAWMAVLVLAGLVGTAQAQVATTDLVPAAPGFFHYQAIGINGATLTPENPAALAWGGPSRVAAGLIKGTIKDNLGVLPDRNTKGNFVGARLVGQTFGIAAEQMSVKDDSSFNLGTYDKTNDIQLSLNVGNWLGLGVGSGKTSSDALGLDLSRKEFGASVRVNEVWYFGLGAVKDTLTPSGSPTSFDRNGVQAGVALRTEGDIKWYVGLDYVKLNTFPAPFSGMGFKGTRLSVQMLAHSFLIGAASAKLDVLDTPNPPDVSSHTFDIGYAPMQGLSVTARVQSTNVKDNAPTDESVDTTSVAVAYQF
ncbi:MAG TPA: hypothetical protein VKB51_07905 [bacterium]|nr:hypothetical protein [bacterium]